MSEPVVKSSLAEKGAGGPIFVVDDEAMLLDLATLILKPLRFPIRTFRDPVAALDAFRGANPRPILLITDYAMDDMNGMALIAACRSLEPGLKTLLISGTVGQEVSNDSVVKPNAFLGKPYRPKQLVELVESILAR